MSDVTWRAHPRYDGYEVSDDGRIRSISRMVFDSRGFWRPFQGRELKLSLHKNGMVVGTQ